MATIPTRAGRVIAFIEACCLTPSGAKVGQPLKLMPFQKQFIEAIYSNPAGTRRAFLSVGRKNGKSALIACLVLVHLIGPEAKRNSQIISGAMSREQAAIVYETGPLTDGKWKDAQSLPGDWYVQIGAIESFGILK